MNLKKYDDKCVLIEDIFNDKYEGIAIYNNREYNFHEYNKDEESLEMDNIIFYKSIIKRVRSLENKDGPFGKFSSKYGKLEEFVIESGIDIIEEVFDSEENIHIYRLLLCMEDRLDSFSKKDKKKLEELLTILIKYNQDKMIIEIAQKIKDYLLF